MPQIMSDTSGVRHYFKLRGQAYPVTLPTPHQLNQQDFQHIANTLYAELQHQDVLLSELQPFRGQYAPVAAHLKRLILRHQTTVQAVAKQYIQDRAGIRTSALFSKFASAWRQHAKHEQAEQAILNDFRQVLDRTDHLAHSIRFRTYGERWQRMILVWMLIQPNDPYLKMAERYLQGDSSSFYEACWWDMPAHTYSRTQWEALGYEPCANPTIRYWTSYNTPTTVYTHWQVAPSKNKAEARQAFWVNQVMQSIPAIAAAFVSAYPPVTSQSDYDALIYDMACIVSGEFGHEYYDWSGHLISMEYGRDIVKMNFAQEVYRIIGWDFSTYTYYEFAT